jgi:hypothetical protein
MRAAQRIPILGALVSHQDTRIVSWGVLGAALAWDPSWAKPPASNASLIAKVCEQSLVDARPTGIGSVSVRPGHVPAMSVRRLTMHDVSAAAILEGRADLDVCGEWGLAASAKALVRRFGNGLSTLWTSQ